MNIHVDFGQLINSKLNDELLNTKSGNLEADRTANALIRFANKYGFFGIDAMNFITDLVKTFSDLSTGE